MIVNESPWGSSLANLALRFLEAAVEAGMQVTAVFFRDDGVYNVLPASATDAGALDLCKAWLEVSETHGIDLMMCSAAAGRRFPRDLAESFPAPYRQASLMELIGLMEKCDRVVSF